MFHPAPEQLAQLLSSCPLTTQVYVREGKFQVRNSFWKWIPWWIQKWAAPAYTQTNTNTYLHLEKIFGSSKIKSVCKRILIPWEVKKKRGAALTKEEVAKLFAAIGSYRVEDVENIALKKEALDSHFKAQFPFKNLSDAFLSKAENFTLSHHITGSSYSLVRLQENLALTLTLGKTTSYKKWAYLMAKRVIDREPDIGTVVPGPYGYYALEKIIANQGLYAQFWKALTPSDKCLNTMVLRGTRFSVTATQGFNSLVEDIRTCLGSNGVIKNYAKIQEATKDWKTFRLIGNSLGGAQALRLAATPLISKIDQVTVTCTAGLEKATLKYFVKISNIRTTPLKIRYLEECGDVISLFGGQLGWKCHPDKVNVKHFVLHAHAKENHHRLPHPEKPLNLIKGLKILFVDAFGHAHIRDTFAGLHHISKMTDLHEIQDHLYPYNHAQYRYWEHKRRMISLGNKHVYRDFLRKVWVNEESF